MGDLFSGLFTDGKAGAKKTFANPNTIFNTTIIVLQPTGAVPCLQTNLYPVLSTSNGIARTGKKMGVGKLQDDREMFEHFFGGLSSFLVTFLPAHFDAWAQKRSIPVSKQQQRILFADWADSNQQTFIRYYHSVWKSYWLHLTQHTGFFQHTGNLAVTRPEPDQLVPLQFCPWPIRVSVRVSRNNDTITVMAVATVKDKTVDTGRGYTLQHLLLVLDDTVYLPEDPLLFHLLGDVLQQGSVAIASEWEADFLRDDLPRLQEHFSVELDAALQPEVKPAAQMTPCLALSEMEPDLLVLKPIFRYDEAEVEYDPVAETIDWYEGSTHRIIRRDKAAENAFKLVLQELHPAFVQQQHRHFFYLPVREAIKDNWFFDLVKRLQDLHIDTFGQTNLKKFRYNTSLPQLQIGTGSGIDWFELRLHLHYGDQSVTLRQLRQAILNRQEYVQLSDGTWGLLPEEWLKKLTHLFALGTTRDEQLTISKQHFTLVDDWPEKIDTAVIQEELALKKQLLLQSETQVPFPLPKKLKASLRPYQEAGYQWLRQLHQLGWGGCLADDMGLGKTLQTLSFLLSLAEKQKDIQLLIVCPTSLLFNWAAEIEKFTPSLTYHLYHGANRALPAKRVQLLLTSYGTLRNDIADFSATVYDVIVLDESQVIKNAGSQMAKAILLLQAKSRFVLSGTPIQNNTMDIYAQLHFANPGLLGSMATFKTCFATPVDKHGDTDAATQLKKIVQPFLLRRTKTQVAKDLPDKVETIIYCEMDTYQRQVYDAVKEDYRTRILTDAGEQGMAGAMFVLLEGLNKLRMICDCPSLLQAEAGKRFKKASVKVEELLREIEDNGGGHKTLVFSQFTGMLRLVEEALQEKQIRCLYLDGSTAARKRGGLVKQFQEDDNIRIFLISLKAGGVGLNLTAADYVYLLDPWWNPAAEDQAIDRSHRIGQKQKVFAYKMICKDTVEEKIIQLQQKKKQLAKELISEETAFVKKLTLDDVAFLLG